MKTWFIVAGIFLHAVLLADSYKLFLGTFDDSYPERAQKHADEIVKKAQAAGIETHIKKVRNQKGTFRIVESVRFKDKAAFIRAKNGAKRAGLDFFSKRYPSATNANKREVSQKREKKSLHRGAKQRGKSAVKTKPSLFFGSNDTMVRVIEEGLALQKQMASEKRDYLKSVAKAYDDSGLALKLVGERALNSERNGIETAIVWDLLDGGYVQKRRIKREKELQKGIHFDTGSKNISENYRRLASYEMEAVKNSIRHHFTKERTALLEKMKRESKKRVQQGLLTGDRYDRIRTEYRKERESLLYFEKVIKKPFDMRYRRLVKKIEKIRLLSRERMQKEAVKNSIDLKVLKERSKLLETDYGWTSKVKADIYLDRKQYTFIDRRETLAGMHVKIPFNLLSDEREMLAIEKRQLQRKLKSEKMLLKRIVAQYYDSISYKQNKITRITEEIAMARKEISMVAKKRRLGIITQNSDPRLEKMRHRLHILKLQEDRWLLRADILQELVELQYLSGIKVL